MREIVERVAVAREAPPLGIDQRVQVVGKADDLGWIAPRELHALAGFDLADLPLEPLERQQHERQQAADDDEHRQRDTQKPPDQDAAKPRLPLVVRLER